MYLELKENVPHGTKAYPYTQYHIHRMSTSFQVPVHWHDELEIIYVIRGELKVSINGEEYVAVDGKLPATDNTDGVFGIKIAGVAAGSYTAVPYAGEATADAIAFNIQ